MTDRLDVVEGLELGGSRCVWVGGRVLGLADTVETQHLLRLLLAASRSGETGKQPTVVTTPFKDIKSIGFQFILGESLEQLQIMLMTSEHS